MASKQQQQHPAPTSLPVHKKKNKKAPSKPPDDYDENDDDGNHDHSRRHNPPLPNLDNNNSSGSGRSKPALGKQAMPSAAVSDDFAEQALKNMQELYLKKGHAANKRQGSESSSTAAAAALPPSTAASAAAQDANDIVYKALMEHKNAEMQRMAALASDTRTITEAMLRKQVEAQRTKLAVSASAQYATNAKYVEVNSGRHPQIAVFAGMHALSPDEVDVFSSLVEKCPSSRVTVMHNHCMSDQGMIKGFRFTMDARENHQFLPLNRKMYFRHTMVECLPSALYYNANSLSTAEAAAADATSSQEDRMILELLLRQNEVKDRLVKIMQKLYSESQGGNDADFECMPMNMDVLDSAGMHGGFGGSSSSSSLAASFHARRTADCKKWNPDMPELLGLYHAYVRGYNKDTRTHKLFIITSGGCSNLSDKFYNCFVDIRGSAMTADDVLESEESYYLKRINGRNNNRILKMVADEMGLCIPSILDSCAYDPYEVATPTTETMVNDLKRQKDGRITFMSKCTDTTCIENGVLCCMHPAEGFWLFKGSSRHNSSINHYGGPFGSEARQTCMPTVMNKLHRNYSWSSKGIPGSPVCNRGKACSVQNRVSSNIAKVDRQGQVVGCGPSAMEAVVMSKGGRVPDSVVGASTAADSVAGGDEYSQDAAAAAMAGKNNLISASYILAASANSAAIHGLDRGGAATAATTGGGKSGGFGYGGGGGSSSALSISSVYSCTGYWQSSAHLRQAACGASNPGAASSNGGWIGSKGGGYDGQYTYMDEEYMGCLQAHMNWERDNGTIHLMPIAVVYQEDMA